MGHVLKNYWIEKNMELTPGVQLNKIHKKIEYYKESTNSLRTSYVPLTYKIVT